MSYISHTGDDRKKMLDKIGMKSMEELFDPIPKELRLQNRLNIPVLSEMELLNELEQISNLNATELACFAGGGVYDHFIPAA